MQLLNNIQARFFSSQRRITEQNINMKFRINIPLQQYSKYKTFFHCMKKYISIVLLLIINYGCFAQNTSVLVRHDTSLLRADECEWIVKSLVKNNPALTVQIGKSVPQIMLQAIEKNIMKAFDPETGERIPAKQIFEWKAKTDTVPEFDANGNISRSVVVKNVLDPSAITQIRIFQDWYFDIVTGKFQPQVKWIELLLEVKTSSGMFIGYQSYCRIFY